MCILLTLKHFNSEKARFEWLDPEKHAVTSYPIQTVQPVYLYNNTFEECLQNLISYGENL